MFFKKKPAQDQKATPAANDGAAAAQPQKPVFKDRPRPFSIFRDEAAKTAAVQKQADTHRGSADGKLNGLETSLPGKIEQHTKELKEAGEKRVSLRKDTVEQFTAEVTGAEKSVKELQEKLDAETARLNRSRAGLKTAIRELGTEATKVKKEHKAAHKSKKKELDGEIAAARKARREVYSKTARQLRGERWRTVSRTTKEALAVVPDLSVRFARAAKRGIWEVGSVFSRSARSMKQGFGEPTAFSITREKPLETPKASAVKKEAPKPPAAG